MSSIHELAIDLDDADPAKAYKARQALADLVARSTRPGGEQAAVAASLAEALTARVKSQSGNKQEDRPKHSAAARRQIAEFLGQVAGDSEVPALAGALGDLETREAARCALERVPGTAATAALAAAADAVGPEFRIGVMNSLALRKGNDAQAALLRAAADLDTDVRLAAIEALSQFAEPSNDEPITAATKSGSARARSRAQKARVRLADTLRIAGKKDAAVAIYKAIVANDADEPQKKAARLAIEQLT